MRPISMPSGRANSGGQREAAIDAAHRGQQVGEQRRRIGIVVDAAHRRNRPCTRRPPQGGGISRVQRCVVADLPEASSSSGTISASARADAPGESPARRRRRPRRERRPDRWRQLLASSLENFGLRKVSNSGSARICFRLEHVLGIGLGLALHLWRRASSSYSTFLAPSACSTAARFGAELRHRHVDHDRRLAMP